MILVFKHVIPKHFIGLTVWPFVFLKNESLRKDEELLNHEAIHLKQQLELFLIPFFIWYGIEYLIRLIQYRDTYRAYRNISFEREAYAMEYDLDYLNTRSRWAFLRYL